MEDILIAAVQMRSELGDYAANIATMERIMRRAKEEGALLVLFPEACLTGYSMEHADEVALAADSAEVRRICDLADYLGIAACFGFIERDADTGALFMAQPLHVDCETMRYRKTHLGPSEASVISTGDSVPVIDVYGVCVGVQVCYETHFPELSAMQRAQGAQVVLMPFASGIGGEERRASWQKYLPARALDNDMFVVACNALRDEAGQGGGIAVYDPQGNDCGGYFGTDECVFLADIGGLLPRERANASMSGQSFFERRRAGFGFV